MNFRYLLENYHIRSKHVARIVLNVHELVLTVIQFFIRDNGSCILTSTLSASHSDRFTSRVTRCSAPWSALTRGQFLKTEVCRAAKFQVSDTYRPALRQ